MSSNSLRRRGPVTVFNFGGGSGAAEENPPPDRPLAGDKPPQDDHTARAFRAFSVHFARRYQPALYTAVRILVALGVAAALGYELYLLSALRTYVTDHTTEMQALERQTAATMSALAAAAAAQGSAALGPALIVAREYQCDDAIATGDVVSATFSGRAVRGFGLAVARFPPSAVSVSCLDFDGQCSWAPAVAGAASPSVEDAAALRVLFSLPSSVTGALRLLLLSLAFGRPSSSAAAADGSVPPSLRQGAVAVALDPAVVPTARAARAGARVLAAASVSRGAAALLLLGDGSAVAVVTPLPVLGAAGQPAGPNATAATAATVALGTVASPPEEPEFPFGAAPNAFLVDVGGAAGLLAGVPCGVDRCCLSLLQSGGVTGADPGAPSASWRRAAELVVDQACPPSAAALGSHVALASQPLVIVAATVAPATNTWSLSVFQTLFLGAATGPLGAVVAVPPFALTPMFFIACARGNDLLTYAVAPPASAAGAANATLAPFTRYVLQSGPTATFGAPVRVTGAALDVVASEVFVAIDVDASAQYLQKVSLAQLVVSASLAIDGVPPPIEALTFVPATGGVVCAGAVGSAAVALTQLRWIGGLRVRGIARSACAGLPARTACSVAVSGVISGFRGLLPGQPYAASPDGGLAVFRNNAATRHGAVVGTALTDTELFIDHTRLRE